MPDTAIPVTEPSISDLRVLLNTPAPDTETPAPAAKAAEKPAPASDPVVTEEAAGERDEAGKFKAKDKEPEDSPGVAKRIGRLLQTQREVERERDELKARLASGSQPAKETAPPAAPAGKPVAKDFETYEAFIEAIQDWKLDQRDAARAQAESVRENAKTYSTREAEAKAAHTDFDEVMAAAANMAISRTMHDAIREEGPEIAYWFAQNADETARIAKLAPGAAQREIGRILATLAKPAAAAASSKDKPAAGAKPLPRPPANVGGSHAPATTDLNDPNLSMKDFKRHAAKLLAE